MWLLAIISLGRWGTSTFLAFPDLPRPSTLTRVNLVTGTIFWYFWRRIIRPQLTVMKNATGLIILLKVNIYSIFSKGFVYIGVIWGNMTSKDFLIQCYDLSDT